MQVVELDLVDLRAPKELALGGSPCRLRAEVLGFLWYWLSLSTLAEITARVVVHSARYVSLNVNIKNC